ncbi:hypothetical protein niasHS_017678 [Heterodera schachtii]|uniref:Histone-lysine N-methyltransferase, H3 lysine-79 specific n=1 Tax=Heterodera schachtii TaxID=97005 RepID=A0ABD2HWH9_HETSC
MDGMNNNAAANEPNPSSLASCDIINKNVVSCAKNKNGHGHSYEMNGKSNQCKDGAERKKPIRLQSPVGAQPITWNWSAEAAGSSLGVEVLDIIRLAICHYPEFDEPLKGRLENVDVSNYDQMRSLAKKFNKVLTQTSQFRSDGPLKTKSREILHQIVTRCYNRAVDNEKALNKHYEAFSSQTYGETSFERMRMIIDELRPTERDVFVDLGSGVGQLVVQVAGGSQVQKAVGIEIAKLPADFARKLESEFKRLMNWFGRQFRPFELKHGDFLNEQHRSLITEEATIIFINNFAFQSDLEMRIKRELLSDLKQGTRIISTKPYVPLNKQGAITDRQLNDISVITDVVEMKACPNPCSWTSAYVPYYLHTINRKKLEMYFTQKNSSRCKSSDFGSRRSSTPNSKASNSRESSLDLRDKSENGRTNGEDICFGPTTRRKWHEYVSDLEQQKKRKGGAGSSTTPDERSVTNSSSGTPTPVSASSAPPFVSTALPNNATANTPLPQKTICVNNLRRPSSIPELINSVKEEPVAESSPVVDISVGPANALVVNPIHQQQNHLINEVSKFEPITPIANRKNDEGDGKKNVSKRNNERKEKVQPTVGGKRGRPSKADKMLGTHASPKMPRLSDDAKDGMEVMHQMTLSVQAGKPIDPASILADMAEAKRRSVPMDTINMALPFPNLSKPFNDQTQSGGDIQSHHYTERYPGLSKFLDGMRGVFENWFDNVYSSKQTANDDGSALRANNSKDTSPNANSTNVVPPNNVQFRSILDQTPVKCNLAEDESIGSCHSAVFDERERTGMNKLVNCAKRVEECRKSVADKFQEYQAQVQQLNKEMDTLLNELRLQHRMEQQQKDSQTQQIEQQQQQMVVQQQQQQLIAAVQAQLATTHQNVAAQQSQPFQHQHQALVAALANNQLDLMINEIQTQYSRQLSAQQLLAQLSRMNFLGIPPQDISTLQNIASGSALSEIVRQMSPVTAAAAALHSPLSSAGVQNPPPGPSPVQHQMSTTVSNCSGPIGVQNFLNNLESLNNGPSACSATTRISTPTTISANLSAVAVEVGHTTSNLGNNTTTSPTNSGHRRPVGQPASLSLRQVSQNFACPSSSGVTSTTVPTPSSSSNGISSSQLTRESTVAEVVAEVAALPTTVPRKPFRPRPARTSGAGGKRGGQNTHKQQTAEDPKKQEEIERQIQDIVAKALEVDSAAKYAEKERKARGGEKRNKDKSGGSTVFGIVSSIPSTSSSLTLPTTTSAILDRAFPPVMQNFLTAAVAAQQKHIQQQSDSVGSGSGSEFRMNSITGPSLDQQQQTTETQSPLSSPSVSMPIQTHFSFTPSSISLAIQNTGLVVTPFTTVNSSKCAPQAATTEPNNVLPMFLHPKESRSPPFISLNLPPTTSAALVTPPTNVVVKVEPKVPSISGSNCRTGLFSASPSTLP